MALRLETIDQQVTNTLNNSGAPTTYFDVSVTDLVADTNQTINLNGGGSVWANFGIGKIFTNALDGIRTFIGLGSNVDRAVIVAHSPVTVSTNGFDGQVGIYASNGDDTINLVNAHPTIEQTLYAIARAVLDTVDPATDEAVANNPTVASINWATARTNELIGMNYTEGHALMEVAKVYLQALPGYSTMSDEQFVNYLYNQVLGTEVNEAGKAYCMTTLKTWGGQYANNTRADLLKLFVTSTGYMQDRDILAQAEAWGDAAGIRMGMETVVSLGAGNDVIRLGLGDNTIIAGAGDKTYEISMHSYGASDIDFRTYDTMRLIDDRIGAHVEKVNVFVNDNGTAAVRLTLENGGIVNLHGDQYMADRVSYAFGVATPAAGQSVEVRGYFEAPVITAVLDIKNETAYQVDPALITPPGEYPENQMIVNNGSNVTVHGNDFANIIIDLGSGNRVSGGLGEDQMDLGPDSIAWGGPQDDTLVALRGGKNDLSGEEGRDILVGKIGTTLRGGDHEDTFVIGVGNGTNDRAVVDLLEAWDTLQFYGQKPGQEATILFFDNATGPDVINFDFGDGRKVDAFADQFTLDQFIARTGAQRDEFGNAQAIQTGIQLNENFGTSADGGQVADVNLVGQGADGVLQYTGWQYHNQIV